MGVVERVKKKAEGRRRKNSLSLHSSHSLSPLHSTRLPFLSSPFSFGPCSPRARSRAGVPDVSGEDLHGEAQRGAPPPRLCRRSLRPLLLPPQRLCHPNSASSRSPSARSLLAWRPAPRASSSRATGEAAAAAPSPPLGRLRQRRTAEAAGQLPRLRRHPLQRRRRATPKPNLLLPRRRRSSRRASSPSTSPPSSPSSGPASPSSPCCSTARPGSSSRWRGTRSSGGCSRRWR